MRGFAPGPRPVDGKATRVGWERPGSQLLEKSEGTKTQDHTSNIQVPRPPSPSELESGTQESACLGSPRGILTPANARLWAPAEWIPLQLATGDASIQLRCLRWTSLSHFPPPAPRVPPATGLLLSARGGQDLGGRQVCLGEIPESPAWRDHHQQPCQGETALPVVPLGELDEPPSLGCPHLPDFKRTSYKQGVWNLGTPARTTPNAAAQKHHLPWSSRRCRAPSLHCSLQASQ